MYRQRVLRLYKDIYKTLSGDWQIEVSKNRFPGKYEYEVQEYKKAQEIKDETLIEARQTFKENKGLTDEKAILEMLETTEKQVEIAKHYNFPHQRYETSAEHADPVDDSPDLGGPAFEDLKVESTKHADGSTEVKIVSPIEDVVAVINNLQEVRKPRNYFEKPEEPITEDNELN